MLRSVLVLLAFVAGASTALAGGSLKDGHYEPEFNWSGLYIGVHGGYGWGEFHDVGNPAADKKKIDGGFGGVQVGYNWQSPSNVVFGIEADVSLGGPEKDWLGHVVSGNQFDPYYGSDEVKWSGTVRGRLGLAYGRFLPYITGGLVWSENEHTLGCDKLVAPGGSNGCKTKFNTSDTEAAFGWVVGGGLEVALDSNWSVKAEYLYSDIGTGKVSLIDPNYPAVRRDFDGHENSVRGGLNYRF
jgi:outer membrane immunogenic protein